MKPREAWTTEDWRDYLDGGRPMSETFVQKQIRLVLEQQCHDAAVLLKDKLPAGVGFALFTFDFGEGGNLAYVSNGDRDDVLRLMGEWFERELAKRGIVVEDGP